MTSWDDRTLVEDLVAAGVDDWVDAGLVYSIAKRTGLTDKSVLRAASVGLIAEVLLRRLMDAGDIGDRGFEPWDCTPAEAFVRIATDWFGRDNPILMPGEVAWLNNTPDGAALGKHVLQREGH